MRHVAQQAVAYARDGWPVFPCRPGRKAPATRHGFRDATTDPDQISWWWRRMPDANVAIATGAPGPDVLDVDQHGEAGSGFAALDLLDQAGLLECAGVIVRTPSGGMHLYFTGSDQASGRLPRQHLDFRARGGYVVAAPSQVGGSRYRVIRQHAEAGDLDWRQVVDLFEPGRTRTRSLPEPARQDGRHLAVWLATQGPGSHNRNDGLFWAACRAAEIGDETALSELAAVALTAGLTDREVSRTIESAVRTAGHSRVERQSTREAAT